jgi:hypothetical protein
VNNRAIGPTVNVVSDGDRFYDTGAGTLIIGGLSSNNTRADGNTIDFEAHGDQFIGNDAASEFDHGGPFVIGTGGSRMPAAAATTRSTSARGSRSLGNDTSDLGAIGARSLSVQTAPLSQHNRVTIEIRGSGSSRGEWQPVEYFVDSLPASANYDNSVTVLRH